MQGHGPPSLFFGHFPSHPDIQQVRMKTLQALGLEPPSGHLFHQTSVDFHTLEALQLQQRRLRMAFPEVGG